jgi:hypothetical protein
MKTPLNIKVNRMRLFIYKFWENFVKTMRYVHTSTMASAVLRVLLNVVSYDDDNVAVCVRNIFATRNR